MPSRAISNIPTRLDNHDLTLPVGDISSEPEPTAAIDRSEPVGPAPRAGRKSKHPSSTLSTPNVLRAGLFMLAVQALPSRYSSATAKPTLSNFDSGDRWHGSTAGTSIALSLPAGSSAGPASPLFTQLAVEHPWVGIVTTEAATPTMPQAGSRVEPPPPRPMQPTSAASEAPRFMPTDEAGTALAQATPVGATYPRTPGFEHAFAWACLHDPAAYTALGTLLARADAVVGKLLPPHAHGAGEPYAEEAVELGSSGRDPARIREVIESLDPARVPMRDKLALLYRLRAWLPREIQSQAGLTLLRGMEDTRAFDCKPLAERLARQQAIERFADGLGLDFPLSAPKLGAYSRVRIDSPRVRDFIFTPEGEARSDARAINPLFFEPRDHPLRSPYVRKQAALEPRRVEVARWDPAFQAHVDAGRLSSYRPRFESIETNLLNGTTRFVLNETDPRFRANAEGENWMVATGPSGTVAEILTLADILGMTPPDKLSIVKAMIAVLHLDDHHTVHESLEGTLGHADMDRLIGYDGTRRALDRVDPLLYDQAMAMLQAFVVPELAARSRTALQRTAMPDPAADEVTRVKAGQAAACAWLDSQYERLAPLEQQRVEQALAGARLVFKAPIADIAERLGTIEKPAAYPFADKLNGSTSVKDDFRTGARSVTLVPEGKPVVATFTRNRRTSKNFYGMVYNPKRLVPLLAATRDVATLGDYRREFWSGGAEAGPSKGWRFNGRVVSNVSPDGELCHEMRPVMRQLARDMIDGRGTLDFIAGHVTTHNEMLVSRHGDIDAGDIAEGVFVDLVSNYMLFTTSLLPMLEPLKRIIPVEAWLSGFMAMNVAALEKLPEQFEAAKRACADSGKPFFVRMADAAHGSRFVEADIQAFESIVDLARAHGVAGPHEVPTLVRLFDAVTNAWSAIHSLLRPA